MGPLDHLQSQEPVLSRLEDFFASPDFTTAVGQFMGTICPHVLVCALEDEQPMQNHDAFCRYTNLIEELLEGFIRKECLSPDEVIQLVDVLKRVGRVLGLRVWTIYSQQLSI